MITTSMARKIRGGADLPASPVFKDVFMKSGANAGLYVCLSAGTWSGPLDSTSDAGDVVGPASSTDNAITRFDGAGGKTVQNSLATVSDAGTVNIPAGQTYNINGVPVGATPAGSTTQVQYNNAGAFGGISGVTTDGVNITALPVRPISGNTLAFTVGSVANANTVKIGDRGFGSGGEVQLNASGGSPTVTIDSANGLSLANGQKVGFNPDATFVGNSDDAGISRGGVGIVAVGNGTLGDASGILKYTKGRLQPLTVATLGAGTAGDYAYVTDGDAGLAWGATVVNTGAGATKYLVWFNGTNWTVAGK